MPEPEPRKVAVSDPGTVVYRATLRDLAFCFLRLGTMGFGGPIALDGHMQRDLVEERRWVSRQDHVEGLAFSQLSPGPLAAQLAMYLGWAQAGAVGATLIGILFILPSFLMVLALAAVYVHFGGLPWIQGIFYRIGAAVIAIIARSAINLVKGTIGRDWLLWTICAALAVTTACTESEIVWLFLLCGAIAPSGMPGRASSVVFVGGLGPLLTGIHGLASIATVGLLFEGWSLRIRKRSGDRAVSVRRSCRQVPLADRTPVCGCRCCGDDYTWTSGDHSSLHRLSCRPRVWGSRSSTRSLRSSVLSYSAGSSLLPAVRQAPAAECFRARCYSSGCWCNRGCRLHSCASVVD